MNLQEQTKISVVVVTKDRHKDCTELLLSLCNQQLKPFEVILVDCSSQEYNTPPKIVNELKLSIHKLDDTVTLSEGRSLGVSAAKGDIIAFVDDDAVASSQWIKELLEAHNDGVDILGGSIKPAYQTSPPRWWNETLFNWAISINPNKEIYGVNMSMTKETFKITGSFNPSFGRRLGKLLGGEEGDLIMRAKKAGLNVGFAANAVVYHKIPYKRLSLVYLLKRAFYGGFSLSVAGYIHPTEVQPHVVILERIREWLRKVSTLPFKDALLGMAIAVPLGLSYSIGKIYGSLYLKVTKRKEE